MQKKTNDSSKQVILLTTDKDSPIIIHLYNALNKASQKHTDVIIAFHQKDTIIPSFIKNSNHYLFTNNVLTEMGFNPIGSTLVPGNNHFPLLKYYRENPGYDYYWVIEDDVRFNGGWELLFNAFQTDRSDFITCCVRNWEKDKGWYWWQTLIHDSKNIPLEKRIASFNPIYRISNLALRFINMSQLDGWRGHHEVLFPTLLKYGGYIITDFGGDGDFVLPDYANKFYINSKPGVHEGTMRFGPAFHQSGNLPDKLYHPVKDFYWDTPNVSKVNALRKTG